MSRLHGLWSLGTLIGGLLSSRLAASGLSLQTHLTASAIVVFAVVLTVYNSLPSVDYGHDDMAETKQDADQAVDQQSDKNASPDPGNGPMPAAGRSALVLLFLAGAFAIAAEGVPMGWAAFRVADDFSTGPGLAVLGYVAFAGGMTVGRLSGDFLAARFGAHRHMRTSAAISAVGLTAATLGPFVWLTLIGFLVGGLGTAALLPHIYDLAARLPGRRGAGLGALTGGLRTADLIFPTLVGALAVAWSSVGYALAVVVVTGAVGFFVITGLMDS